MAKRKKTGGRQKGTPNKATAAVKEILQEAFDRAGGVDALVRWITDEQNKWNRGRFYELWVKLLPHDVHVSNPDGTPIQVISGVPGSPEGKVK